MSTRNTNYLRTRSGKRYQREVIVEPEESSAAMAVEEPETQPCDYSTLIYYIPNQDNTDMEIEVKEVPYEEWESEVRQMLKDTLEMTDEEINNYPLLEWFRADTDPEKVIESIRRDFFGDEDSFYMQPFEDWQQDVDNLLIKNLGLNRLDLPDYPFSDYFDCLATPMDMYKHIRDEFFI